MLESKPDPLASEQPSMGSSSSSLTRLSSGVLPPPRLNVGVFSKRKGVRYHRDGQVSSCRFCEILRARAEPFLYEDEHVVVFRPLRPIVPSHVLIVPRAHIRNVNRLAARHRDLVARMHRVAEAVMTKGPEDGAVEDGEQPEEPVEVHTQKGDENRVRYSFHVPPFNSIDHVHMHAFLDDPRRLGYYGRIKYRTESWWCRSYEQVMARLTELAADVPQGQPEESSSSSSSGLLSEERQTA
ncbi:Histidine triad nucleotide-binding protein 3 [Phytophthora citrophthora]|uniref:Histidine triad nucleotide-binding protein 3 n=1 Tax=Phytophthora citrophthora TaxID=4793 RepID=A0AAD9GYQ1_9STRA|nr:Histidine triad nucleotide-binding protein 3 [Phytophthora citrophthora]